MDDHEDSLADFVTIDHLGGAVMGRPPVPTSKNWHRVQGKIFRRDKNCFICGKRYGLTVHHIKPRRLGGTLDERNLTALCLPCHDFIESNDFEWKQMVTLRNQYKRGLVDAISHWGTRRPSEHENKIVGKDQFGVFILRDVNPGDVVVYEKGWPTSLSMRSALHSRDAAGPQEDPLLPEERAVMNRRKARSDRQKRGPNK